ncbi:MAG TPA: hypothetical protein VE995_03545 [Gaiellaceae bacterium]|nr:hypothetical protein [Gaiellaceae bacterium]
MNDSVGPVRRRARPRAARGAVVLAVLAALAVVLAPAGTAKPPTSNNKIYSLCLQGADSTSCPAQSHLVAGATTPMTLTIANAASSPSSLGSLNLDAPAGLPIAAASSSASPTGDVTLVAGGGANGTGQLQIRDLNLTPGSTATVSFSVEAPCAGGPYTWPAPAAKQSNDFNGTGNDFNPPTSFAGQTSVLSGPGCYLGFLTQPAATQVGETITDQVASTGGPIEVGLFDGAGNPITTCPVAAASCQVSLATVPGTAGFTGTATRPLLPAANGDLVASFGDLAIGGLGPSDLPQTFELRASSTFTSPAPHGEDTSAPFELEESLVDCSAGCTVAGLPLGGRGDSVLDFDTTSDYGFVALDPFRFTAVPAGCEHFTPLGSTSRTPVSGFSEASPLVGAGMTLTYYVSQNAIKARYGKNVGQQVIPICAGALPVVAGVPVPCSTITTVGLRNDPNGWVDDVLDASGQFTGTQSRAVCNADGYFWGIVPFFQDKVAPGGPLITAWGDTTLGGTNYRAFVMSVPGGWDYKGGG